MELSLSLTHGKFYKNYMLKIFDIVHWQIIERRVAYLARWPMQRRNWSGKTCLSLQDLNPRPDSMFKEAPPTPLHSIS